MRAGVASIAIQDGDRWVGNRRLHHTSASRVGVVNRTAKPVGGEALSERIGILRRPRERRAFQNLSALQVRLNPVGPTTAFRPDGRDLGKSFVVVLDILQNSQADLL